MGFLFLVILWFGVSVIIAIAASARGRNPLIWFLLPLIITPLLAALLLLVVGGGSNSTQPCPRCRETIKIGAKVCRFCGHELPDHQNDAPFPDTRLCLNCGYQVRRKDSRCPRCSTVIPPLTEEAA
ncbi:MAG TPA: zinc ribbon domain-containing protein [Candidatus Sulfotelmatobacter sp.]|jgi:hypothetical protein|nr:zinc ribbon domain-containing protein [Candidatus Sulfotelmatobacter sp.]